MKSPKWLVIVALLVLTGCQSVDYVGSGPLNFSPRHQAHFEKYKSNPITFKYYTVTVDGRGHFYLYCEEYSGCEMGATTAISECEMRYGKPCKIYAEGNDIVWRFDGPSNASGTAVTSQIGGRMTFPPESPASDVSSPDNLKANIATLKRTNSCPGCYLQGANLQEANLEGANLEGAYLDGANLRGADLKGAKLDSTGLKIARASGAYNIPNTAVTNEKSPPKIAKKPTTSDIEIRLRKLQGLENKGLITKEDAARKRKELLEKL